MLFMAKKLTKFMLTTKLGMTQVYGAKGELIAVTLLRAKPNVVTQVKTIEKDKYAAVQLNKKKEFKTEKEMNVGDTIDVSVFAPGDTVKVSGLTKGKGFAGAVKRHGFHGAPASHGHGHVTRHVGSIGQRFPQHTLKGMRGPGRDGQERVAIRGLKVIAIDVAQSILAVKGAVPGAKGTVLEVIA